MGTPPGGPGREAEEFVSCGAAYGAHTFPHWQRQGEVFTVSNHFFYPLIHTFYFLYAMMAHQNTRLNICMFNNLCSYVSIYTSKVYTCFAVAA